MRSMPVRLLAALLLAGSLLSACQTTAGSGNTTPQAEDPTRSPSGY